ncbi:MAG TPA: hypothetical protein VHY22_04890 [Chthoniobacteraceae bacterium]|jgi:hypothetical protein|nr:hypothetical protein [Chthoniobacteraceae bacterium]
MSQSRPVDFAAYKAVRDEIAHEDTLMGTRLNWFFASQAFLLTALAIANRTGGPVLPSPRNDFYFPLIPLLAITSCVLIALGIIGGAVAIRRWRRLLGQMIRQDPSLPAIGRDGWIMRLGWSAPVLLPLAFLAAWSYLLIAGFAR